MTRAGIEYFNILSYYESIVIVATHYHPNYD